MTSYAGRTVHQVELLYQCNTVEQLRVQGVDKFICFQGYIAHPFSRSEPASLLLGGEFLDC